LGHNSVNVVDYLENHYELEFQELFTRFGHVVDIYQQSKRCQKKHGRIGVAVRIVPENTWYYPKDENELADIAINHIEFYKELRNKKSHMEQKPRYTFQTGGRDAGKTAASIKALNSRSFKSAGGLKDDSPMPFGKHQGEKMANIDPSYLIWLFENDKCNAAVRAYIHANEDVLRSQIKQTKR
jgi:hypothetical protein